MAPYPQYARSEEPLSFSGFAEKFKYLEPGESEEAEQNEGNGDLIVEGGVYAALCAWLTDFRQEEFTPLGPVAPSLCS